MKKTSLSQHVVSAGLVVYILAKAARCSTLFWPPSSLPPYSLSAAKRGLCYTWLRPTSVQVSATVSNMGATES